MSTSGARFSLHATKLTKDEVKSYKYYAPIYEGGYVWVGKELSLHFNDLESVDTLIKVLQELKEKAWSDSTTE